MIPATSDAAYDAARRRAALVDRSDRGRVLVRGADRASYLQGLLTNDVVALKSGEGCYAAYLTAQGRMISDLHVYELGDLMLLTMAGEVKDAVIAKLDQFIFSEDVQLGDVTETFAQMAVVGPDAARAVSTALGGVSADVLGALPEHGNLRAEWAGGAAIVTRVTDTGEPGYDLFVDREQAAALEDCARRCRRRRSRRIDGRGDSDRVGCSGLPPRHGRGDDPARGEHRVARHQLHQGLLRRAGGRDSRVAPRPRPRGAQAGRSLHRRRAGAAAGAVIRSADREIGRVTSSTLSPALKRPIALGYVHRDFLEPGTKVTIGEAAAEVTALPFVKRQA